jgi:methylglutaconyl-CoA hydratase
MKTTVLTRGLYLSAKVTSNTRQRPLKLFKRWYQVANAPEAFLERLEPHPGITCLNLNRPKSKNAISTTLLQVSSLRAKLSYRFIQSTSAIPWQPGGCSVWQEVHFSLYDLYICSSHSCKNSVRVLILRSTTVGSFCAGADLVERRTMTQTQVTKFLSSLRDALARLESLPVPTIAAIDGPALGGGLEMSLACDLRVAG